MHIAFRILVSFTLIGLFAVCQAPVHTAPNTGRRALIDPNEWVFLSEAEDVFLDHRPSQIDCGGTGYFVEDGILEIDTGRCNYFAANQPLLHDLVPADTLVVTIYHDHLFSADGGFGHLALSITENILWQTEIPIPSESRLFTAYIPVTRFYESGLPIAFHLHNHGVNHWRLVSLEVE